VERRRQRQMCIRDRYNRGVVNPGTPLMYLDGSRMLHERACAVGVENQFYTFPGAPHVPYLANASYMDTTLRFIRDFLVKQMGCTETTLQAANNPLQTATLYAINYCDGTPVNEVCASSGIQEDNISIQLYPNPSNGIIHISSDGASIQSVNVMDMFGKRQAVHLSNGNEIDLSDLPNGTYFVAVELANSQIWMNSLILQH
jgi:hypothetical protein